MRRQQRRYYDSPGFLDAVFGAATQALLPVAWGRSQCARDNFESLELANFTLKDPLDSLGDFEGQLVCFESVGV